MEENKGEASGGNEATSVRRVGRLKHSITVRLLVTNYLTFLYSLEIFSCILYIVQSFDTYTWPIS